MPKDKDNSDKNTYEMQKEEYVLRKRLSRKLPKRRNDVYVNKRTNFNAQLKQCQRMLGSDYNTIYIHGLGAATSRAINLALQLQLRGMGSIEVAARTSTVELVDDLEPLKDELEPSTQTRNNSAVHIKVSLIGVTASSGNYDGNVDDSHDTDIALKKTTDDSV